MLVNMTDLIGSHENVGWAEILKIHQTETFINLLTAVWQERVIA